MANMTKNCFFALQKFSTLKPHLYKLHIKFGAIITQFDIFSNFLLSSYFFHIRRI
jgi:hypothetical protein